MESPCKCLALEAWGPALPLLLPQESRKPGLALNVPWSNAHSLTSSGASFAEFELELHNTSTARSAVTWSGEVRVTMMPLVNSP